MRRIGLLFALFMVGFPLVSGVSFPTKPGEMPLYDGASLLDAASRTEMEWLISSLWDQEKVPLVVVTIPSLSTYEAIHLGVDGYATELFNHWEIGSTAFNRGILLLVSKGDRRARIELGADWGSDHDTQSALIMDSTIIPRFKEGDYGGGLLGGVRGLIGMVKGERLTAPEKIAGGSLSPRFLLLIFGGFFLVVIGLVIVASRARRFNRIDPPKKNEEGVYVPTMWYHNWYQDPDAPQGKNDSGFGSSGGWSGGGSSGGGGATGGW
ncbi:TPM domain-containing protein [bacterium]|nr:TPM domain-containing protein [bacterium]